MLKHVQPASKHPSPDWRASLLVLLAVLLPACQPLPQSTLTQTPTRPEINEWVQVYFSDPTDPQAVSLRGGPDSALASAIRQARLSVDVASYDLDLWSVRDALLEAQRRGISVRMVTDSDNIYEEEIQDLIGAGIPVLGDRREGLMHNKFVVIDGQQVWTGSLNLTLNSAYRNNDNLIGILSAELAENYTNEFEEMYLADQFGPGSPANTPAPRLDVHGTRLEVYFSPDDGVEEQILRLIQSAQKSIKFMAYSFTSDTIAQAILDQAERGVEVAGVFETEQTRSNQGTEFDRLKAAGLAVRLDGNPRNMHHKVMIIDDRTVLTGSYNFSANAETLNDENLLVIHNPLIAGAYLDEFARVFDQALE